MAPPWQPHGNCHRFEGAIVERIVPAVSGVFGLHNRRHQLFIGEASDLHETLLRYRKDAEKLFPGRQPQYFSFEVCETQLRASRAQALIAEHRPSIQDLQLLSLATLPSRKSKRKVTDHDESSDKSATPTPEWPEASTTNEPDATRKPGYYSRGQLVTLGLSFVIAAAAAGFFGLIAGKKIAERRQTALELAATRRPVLASMTSETSKPQPATEDTAADTGAIEGERLPENAAALPPLQVASATAQDRVATPAKAKNNLEVDAVNANQPDVFSAKQAVALAGNKDLSANTWSVQISATKDQSAAQLLQDKLKSKGFDAFIVEAEINSAQWYRVRVGRFSTNQEAEKIRQDLQSKENLANAFVTGK